LMLGVGFVVGWYASQMQQQSPSPPPAAGNVIAKSHLSLFAYRQLSRLPATDASPILAIHSANSECDDCL